MSKKQKELLYKAVHVNAIIFPFLVVIAYFFLFLETYMYIGFIRNFFIVDSRSFLVLAVISGIILVIYKDLVELGSDQVFINNLVFQVNTLALPIILVFYIIMQASEAVKYNNYVYSTFHLQPDTFFLIIIFNLTLVVLYRLDKNKKIVKNIKRNAYVVYESYDKNLVKISIIIMVFICMFIYTTTNITKTISSALNSNLYIMTHFDNTYEDKMRKRWGFYYDFMKFVNDNTDDHSTIVVPPKQGPWLSVGNSGLSRYFVYPKKLINGSYEDLPEERFDYVVIAWGSWFVSEKDRHGWPKIPVEAEKVLYLDSNDLSVDEYDENYDPNDIKNEKAWGLIKVKHK